MITGKLLLFDYDVPTKKGYPIKILITNGTTKRTKPINLKRYSFKKDWNYEKVEPRSSHPDLELLQDILDYKAKLIRVLKNANNNNWDIDRTIKLFKGDENTDSFISYAREHIRKLEERGQSKTASIKKSAVNSLEKFAGGDVMFNDITKSFIIDYRNANGGVHTYLAKLKSIYNEAKDHTIPFKGTMPQLEETRNKNILVREMKMIKDNKFSPNALNKKGDIVKVSEFSGAYHYANYFLLCFYLGGIDLVDLANLRYDEHVANGRVNFVRFKGRTKQRINNKIFPEAQKILDKYDCKPYLVPIHKAKSYDSLYHNYNNRIKKYFKRLGKEEIKFESYVTSKSPRYTFINISQDLGLDERVTEEIVGHKNKSTHSIYKSNYSDKIRDESHFKIISQV